MVSSLSCFLAAFCSLTPTTSLGSLPLPLELWRTAVLLWLRRWGELVTVELPSFWGYPSPRFPKAPGKCYFSVIVVVNIYTMVTSKGPNWDWGPPAVLGTHTEEAIPALKGLQAKHNWR